MFGVNSTSLEGSDGTVSGDPPDRGQADPRRLHPDRRAPTTQIEADLVLLALGFVGPERRQGWSTSLGVEITGRGTWSATRTT